MLNLYHFNLYWESSQKALNYAQNWEVFMKILRAFLVIALATMGLSAWADKVDNVSNKTVTINKISGSNSNGTIAPAR